MDPFEQCLPVSCYEDGLSVDRGVTRGVESFEEGKGWWIVVCGSRRASWRWTMSCYVGILVAAAVFEASTCADLALLFLPFLLPWLRVPPRAGNIEFLALVTGGSMQYTREFESLRIILKRKIIETRPNHGYTSF